MRANDRVWLAGLLIGAFFIWLRERAWLDAPADSLAVLSAWPLFFWLAAPWKFSASPFQRSNASVAVASLIVAVGLVSGFNGLLAVAWAAMLWAWLSQRLEVQSRARVFRLLPLTVLAFPWMALDFASVGWWFRLSAAWSAEQVFGWAGFSVTREGTQLLVAQLPFDVTPACSGMKGLQAMLIAGTALCHLEISGRRGYWLAIACIPIAAWLANTVRVFGVVASALTFGPEFASGWFHSMGGWFVMASMFGLMWLVAEIFRRRFLAAEAA